MTDARRCSATPALEVEDVTWRYEGAETPTLAGLDLRIDSGEVVVLCGPSGSGKSTALRLANGLIPGFHDGELTGRVRIAGHDPSAVRLDELGRLTGTVLQHPRRQFFTDSARAELAFAMENFGWDPERIRERTTASAAKLAGAMPLEARLSHFSGGQQQQLALASAVAHEPGIVVLDEPSSNLSGDAIGRLACDIAALKAAGATVIIAEHRVRYLQDVLDRVVVLREGRVDREWDAAEFRSVSDEQLASEGLRGHVEHAALAAATATGASVEPRSAAARSGPARDAAPAGKDLEVVGLRCVLGGRTVLDLEHASFPAGTVTALRGVNGAGKSTLARILIGLTRSRGEVRLGGRALSRGARQRSSAIVMQDVQRQLFAESVDSEIALAARGSVVHSSDSEARTRALLEDLDLAHLGDRHPLSLSGGQQQRLVIAATQLSQRELVVFDEPSSGVDRQHLESISAQIRSTAARGAVVLLISHDEDLLALAADQALTLRPLPAAPSSASAMPPKRGRGHRSVADHPHESPHSTRPQEAR